MAFAGDTGTGRLEGVGTADDARGDLVEAECAARNVAGDVDRRGDGRGWRAGLGQDARLVPSHVGQVQGRAARDAVAVAGCAGASTTGSGSGAAAAVVSAGGSSTGSAAGSSPRT